MSSTLGKISQKKLFFEKNSNGGCVHGVFDMNLAPVFFVISGQLSKDTGSSTGEMVNIFSLKKTVF